MTIEQDLVAVIGPLCDGRFFPDTAPAGTPKPYVTYQQVGGRPLNFVAGSPDKANARIQFNAWAGTRAEANTLMRAVKAAIQEPPIKALSLGELTAAYDEITTHRGAQQDFSIWHGA
jgi:hypothetical protein